jgi:hypothetical protein
MRSCGEGVGMGRRGEFSTTMGQGGTGIGRYIVFGGMTWVLLFFGCLLVGRGCSVDEPCC